MTAAAAPDSGLNQTVDFYADRFLAVVAKLAEAEAAVQRVRELCARYGEPGWLAAARAVDGSKPPAVLRVAEVLAALDGPQ